MRKLFSLLTAVLFAGSMMAGVESVDFSAQGYENQQAIESYAGTNFTVTFDKGTNSNAPKYYTSGTAIRCYGANTFTVASESTISQIVLTYGASDGSNEITAAPGTFATDTWTGSANSVVFTIGGTSGNRRIKGIEVTFDGEGGGETPGGDTPGGDTPEVTDPTNCAEAATAALSVSANNELYNGGKSYTIQGYVTEIAYAYSASSGNMSFWMADTKEGGKVLEAYKCTITSEENAPAVGDKVAVTGQLTKYNTTPEFAAGCTVAIIEKAGGDTPGGDTPGGDTPATGDAESVDFSAQGYENQQAIESYSGTNFTVTFDKGTNSNAPKYYTSGTAIRCYGANTFTVASTKTIVKIVLTYGSGDGSNEITAAPGTFATDTWTGSANSVVFTIGGTSGQRRIKAIEVTFAEGGDTPVEPSMDYYVVGSMTSWKANASYKLKANAAQAGEYMGEFTFAANDEFKVVYSDGSTIEDANWFPQGVDNNYVITEAGDYTVYFRPAGNTAWANGYFTAEKKETPALTDPTNCAEAAAAALTVSKNNEEYNGGKEYTIQGYVTEIAFAYDATKGNMSFWMADTKDGGKVLEAYKCTITSEENAPAVGDKVAVTGKLTKYNTTPEFATGCTVVIIEKAGGDTPGGDTPGGDDPVVTDPTNCAEAAAAALTVSKNNELYNGGKEYTIEGYVTAIQTAFNSTYKQVSFWMADTENGGNVLQAYRAVCETAADAPAVGDKVAVTGKLTKYGTTPEFAQGCTYVITQKTTNLPVNLGPKTIAEFLELKNTIDTCVLTGVIANVVNTKYGNFDLVEGTDTLYIYGLKDATGANCFESEGLEEGDTLTIKAVYTTYNNAPQAKNAIFVEVKKAGGVTPGAEVEITIADGSFNDYVESYGYWMVEAQNDDYYISLSNDNTQIAQAAGTYTAADLYAEDSYILTETDSINFVSGSIVLAVDAEGVATVTGSLVGNDGNTYILSIVCPAPDEHENDDDSDFIRNFSSYTIDTEYLSEYGDIYVEASDADGYQITLDLYVPTGASGLVAGTYEINSTYEAGTVAAGIYDGGVYPSFAGIATTEGLTNVWYLVSGTVTVDENLNITIDALNSLGHSVKATLSVGSGTGIEETLAAGKAAKTLRNGHILILKGDKTYNVLGAHIR